MTILGALRRAYHVAICSSILGERDGVFSNADRASRPSRELAARMAQRIGGPYCTNVPTGQAIGAQFATQTKEFIEQAFGTLRHVRPGGWRISSTQAAVGIAAFDQYEHLARLAKLAAQHADVRHVLGSDYLITPDIVVGRLPVPDELINARGVLVSDDDGLATRTPLRHANASAPTLHASISCKWTIRSDRAQNTRTEALNLIRNRKGKTPMIMVVTAEPLPSRIASIAIGTGDVDCTYHAALPELEAAANDMPGPARDVLVEELQALVASRRLRDISDLPFDLAI